MTIALLYICTGKYSAFWSEFYRSFQLYFLPSCEKHFFVFTDDLSLKYKDDVTIIYKECKGFPADSLFRYDMFIEIEESVRKYDYTFFMNSNMLCVDIVGKEILPVEAENYLAFTESFGYLGRNPRIFPYERNKKSMAYIPYDSKYHYRYVLGGVNGGRTPEYYSFIHYLAKRIREDDRNGIMAIYHDESHVNEFLFNHPECKVLSYEYALAEGVNAPLKPKIIIRDKTKVSESFNKKKARGKIKHLLFQIKRIYHFVFW